MWFVSFWEICSFHSALQNQIKNKHLNQVRLPRNIDDMSQSETKLRCGWSSCQVNSTVNLQIIYNIHFSFNTHMSINQGPLHYWHHPVREAGVHPQGCSALLWTLGLLKVDRGGSDYIVPGKLISTETTLYFCFKCSEHIAAPQLYARYINIS